MPPRKRYLYKSPLPFVPAITSGVGFKSRARQKGVPHLSHFAGLLPDHIFIHYIIIYQKRVVVKGFGKSLNGHFEVFIICLFHDRIFPEEPLY